MKNLSLRLLKTGLVLLLFFASGVNTFAQFYNGSQLTFGKNRVQHDDRFWSFLRFEKFDTYFYLNGKPAAEYTSRYADKCIRDIERSLDFGLEEKIQFVLFNRLSDLRQSNIGLISEAEYNVGGITHIVGSKVFLYFDGDHTHLEKQIRAGVAQVIVDEMMYGGRITAMIKNSALLSLPDWYIKGLISYLSESWSTDLDNQVRDGIQRGDYRKFNNLTGADAINAGHSMWKFIGDTYGQTTISNIIYLTKISRNVESGFLFVLGISFKSLVAEWIKYYENQYALADTGRQSPDGSEIPAKNKKSVVFSQFRLSPDGRYAAWVANDIGKYFVCLYDFTTGKTKKIMRAGHRLDEKTDFSFPLLAWHPSGQILAIIFEAKGKILMYYYTMEDRKYEKLRLFNIEKVLDFSFAQNGKMMAMSAIIQGQSDIYVYNLAAHTYEPITKDIWDDFQPHFINNSSEIIFSSNRPDDTIRYDVATNFEKASDSVIGVPEHTDLFLYSYKNRSNILRRITNSSLADETWPVQYDKRYFTYLSDQNGITNRYIGRLDSTIAFVDTATHYRYYTTSFPVTDYNRNILEQDMLSGLSKYGEVVYSNGRYHLFVGDAPKTKDLKASLPGNTFYMDQLVQWQIDNPTDTMTSPVDEEIKYIKERKDKKYRPPDNVLIDEMELDSDSAEVNIDNYQFGAGQKPDDSVIVKPTKKGLTIPRDGNYNVEYTVNQLVSQIDFNFLNSGYQQFTGGGTPVFLNPGFNALFKIGIIDLLEDYRITGGIRLSVSLDNNEFFLSFDNLKKRLDKTVLFHRQAMLTSDEYSIIKLRSNSLYYILSWPFSHVWSIKGTGSLRQDKKIFVATDIQNLKEPIITNYWAGLKGELVFDNTRNKGLNLYYGSRWKIFGEYYQTISSESNNLVVLGLDYRHYKKIHKTFIWANRVAASTSFGNNKLIYYLGGVDNWLLPKFDSEIPVSQTNNYAFQTLATNMRGFIQNVRNGNNFALLNSELRFPIFRYLSKKPIKSDFLNNFQIIAFGDVGTAWSGWNPFSEENTVFKQIYDWGPLIVTVKDKRDPFVGGFGAGLRTRILGYFLRLDYAWGVENLEIQKPVFYISLSTDF